MSRLLKIRSRLSDQRKMQMRRARRAHLVVVSSAALLGAASAHKNAAGIPLGASAAVYSVAYN
jgi:hypothetical protein